MRTSPGQDSTLEVSELSKSYPGVKALDQVSLSLLPGEVHALVGENGAGKSTLIKMITGAEFPDFGTVRISGVDSTKLDARTRQSMGVSAIYQELNIVPNMSAVSNVFLRPPLKNGFLVDTDAMHSRFRELTTRFGLSISPDAKAGTLSIADRQMIEIVRAIDTECSVLIMDEPTATLGPSEREKLYQTISELKAIGVSILFISHDLDEVLKISDRISVMRNGRLVDADLTAAWTKNRLVNAMIGADQSDPAPRAGQPSDQPVLMVRDLKPTGAPSATSFELRRGEILGIAGLVGSGRTELLAAIAGNDSGATGAIKIGPATINLPYDVRTSVDHGIVLVPEDRKAQGFIPLMSGAQNVALTDLRRVSNLAIQNRDLQSDLAIRTTQPLGFDPDRLSQLVKNLSGGNQQKLVIGKWLHKGPKVLLLDEPTRGVDIGAKAEIYASIRNLADEGLSVILVSSELPEIVEQADRVLVMANRSVVATLEGPEIGIERILKTIFASEEKS